MLNATPRQIYSREWPGTHFAGGWVDSRDFLDGSGNPRPGMDLITGPSAPERVVISTTLSRPTNNSSIAEAFLPANFWYNNYIAHLRQECHNSKCVIFQEKSLKVLKCYECNDDTTALQRRVLQTAL